MIGTSKYKLRIQKKIYNFSVTHNYLLHEQKFGTHICHRYKVEKIKNQLAGPFLFFRLSNPSMFKIAVNSIYTNEITSGFIDQIK